LDSITVGTTSRPVGTVRTPAQGHAASSGAASARARGRSTFSTSAGQSGACDEAFRPYRQLAIRVLTRALRDMVNPLGTATDRESARAFFAGSTMLEHWCRVAALDPRWLADRAGRLTLVEATRLAQHVALGIEP
jgi:hypothetical protein